MRRPGSRAYSGAVKVDIGRRLHQDWPDLADYLGIEPHQKATFPQGREAQAIWDWLEVRDELHRLAPALDGIGRPDLAARLRETDAPGREPPEPPVPPRRALTRWYVTGGLVTAVALVLLIVLRPWQPADSGNRAAPSASPAAPAPSPQAGPRGLPAWLTAEASAGVTIDSPADDARTKACVEVRGKATGLAGNETVAVAVRNRAAYDDEPFFIYLMEDWTDPAAARSWHVQVNLGTATNQSYDIYALAADRQAVRDALNRPENNLTSDLLTTGVRRGAHVEVHQSGGC